MMVVMCFPSRSDRMMEPSLALRLPMLVQYRCPAAASMVNPSGSFLPSSRMTFQFEPSGFTDRIRPEATSRKKRRPASARSRLGASDGFETLALMWDPLVCFESRNSSFWQGCRRAFINNSCCEIHMLKLYESHKYA